jgi:membrane protein
LQSALLSLYFLVAVLPALLVLEEYLEKSPSALATQLVHHYGLSVQTADLLRGVFVDTKTHEFGSALMAIASALIFGLGLGRVLQIVHARAWALDLPRRGSDQVRFAFVLLGLFGLILLLLLQLNELAGEAAWVRLALAPGWVALLVCFFVWAPWTLTHKLIAWRDLVPGAVLTACALVVLMLVSGLVMEPWVDLFARDYGGFGLVMAIYFWLAFSSAAVVWAASISPPLAQRRRLRALSAVRQDLRGPASDPTSSSA